jgi:hypothetical protein
LQPVLTREQVNQEKKETNMSKNLTRKGLAFGALVALGSTLFAGVPAQANSSGPLTLLPDGGTAAGATYTSLIGAGLTLSSTLSNGLQYPSAPQDNVLLNANGLTSSEFGNVVIVNNVYQDNVNMIEDYNVISRISDITPTHTGYSSQGVTQSQANALTSLITTSVLANNSALTAAVSLYNSQTDSGVPTVTISDGADTVIDFPAWNEVSNGLNAAGANLTEWQAVRDATSDAALQTAVDNYNDADDTTTVGDLQIDRNVTLSNFTAWSYNGQRSLSEHGFPSAWVPETIFNVGSAVDALDPLSRHYFLVENAGGANLTLARSGSLAVNNFYLFNEDGDATGPHTGDQTVTTVGNASVTTVSANTITTNAKKIAVSAAIGSEGARTVADLTINTVSTALTSAVKVKVTSFTDTVNGDPETTTAKINNGELRSATQEVTLLPAASVPVTTKMALSTERFNDATPPVAQDTLNATVTLGSSVNPHAVASSLRVFFFEDGVISDIADGPSTNVVGIPDAKRLEHTGVSVNSVTGALTATATRTDDLPSAVYTARTVYTAPAQDIFVGPRSAALDLRDGTNATVSGVRAAFSKSNDLQVQSSTDVDVVARAGTKSVPVVAQITRDSAPIGDYKAAGVTVRATVTGTVVNEDEGSEITVTGSTDKIVESGDVIVVTGFTNSNGQFPITITSTTGEDLDAVDVKFEVLTDSGAYVPGTVGSVTWATAVLQDELVVTPSEFLTGETVNVTLTAVDQFGVGIDQTENGRVSIRVDAYVDGAVKTATYSETKATTNGSASFSFANFATAGSNSEIQVQIFEASAPLALSLDYLTVYNNVETSSIAIADAFENRVQYVDYVTGKTTDAATLKAATDAGVIAEFTTASPSNAVAGTDFALIVGTALDANNAGQPGIPVTIAAEGVLFHDAETATIAKDSITVIANGQGFFDVQALSQKVNAAGATVTITAGGKTATTLLKTYLPTTIDAKNLKFSWALPANIVKNTTYSVVATLTDVWGNPLNTAKIATGTGFQNTDALSVAADGSLQVNGVATVARNFNNAGQATVFVRSVTDIAGPGQLRAAVGSFNYFTGAPSNAFGAVTTTANVYTDVTTTSWNESLWSGALAVDIDVLDKAPAAEGKVNVGSFNGKLVVYALNLDGAKISWKVAGRWGVANAVGDTLNRFDRPVGASGVNVIVEIYVNGVRQLQKTVLTR